MKIALLKSNGLVKLCMLVAFMSFISIHSLLANSVPTQGADKISEVNVSLKANNQSLEKLLGEITTQTGFKFNYNEAAVDMAQKVSLTVKDKSVEYVLIYLAQNHQLTFKQVNQIINIGTNQKAQVAVEEKEIKGTVTDETNLPIPGVTVVSKNNGTGTVTDIDGHYTIEASEGDVLTFSFIGYEAQQVTVGAASTLDVKLREDLQSLEEVVVVGFGEQKKANLTGAVATVDAKVLESRPVQNVGQMLQGVVPGLNIQTAGLGGELNQSMSFNIRGAGTIGSGSNSSPLVLIDGMDGDLNALNPQDIESVTVLKDAAAASVYGSRAAFGVILITTKSGKDGKAKVNYSSNFRFSKPMGLPDMLDSYKFALYYNEAALNAGQGALFSEDALDRILRYQRGEITDSTIPNENGDQWQYYSGSNGNTDWFKEQYKSTSFSQEHNLSVNGGSEAARYYISANYLDQGGLTRHGGDNFNRYSLAGKFNFKLSDKIQFDYNNRFVREYFTKANHLNSLFYHNVARRWPTVPVYDPNGFYSYPSEINQMRQGGRVNNYEDQYYLQGKITYTPAKNWNIYASGNYSITNINNSSNTLPAFAYDVAGEGYPISVSYSAPGQTEVYEYNRKANYFTSNIYSDYTWVLGSDHNFKVMAGFNSELNKYRDLSAGRTGLITPEVVSINTATDNFTNGGAYNHWATAGFFGRLNYNYKEKYFVELNTRYDGSSRFTREKRWNLFNSFSAGWNLARENFWQIDQVSMLKIRGSYGELGNQNTSSWYPFYLSQPFQVNSGSWLVNGIRPNTASAPGIVSTSMTWERVKSYNIGLDLGLLDNRLIVNFDYFNRYTLDMVGPAKELPLILGTGVPRINNADLKTYGFELEVNWKDDIGDLFYHVRGVLSDDQMVVTKFPNETGNIGQWYDNSKAGQIWGYTTVGIAKTQAEMDTHLETTSQNQMGSNWQAGDIMYADLNGDGTINSGSSTLSDLGDRSVIGNTTPRYRYGLDINANYKNFDLRIFFQGVGKRDWMPNGAYFWGASGQNQWQAAGFEEHMDFFRDENSPMVQAGVAEVNLDSYFPRPTFNQGRNNYTQSRYIQNASYLRLKNLQVGYSLPTSVLSKVKVANVRIYVSGENLLTFTKMSKIFDPETVGLSGWSDGKTYPFSTVYSCGINVNF
ncbi:SusC/RagA family TonB-linked outer membrane protein [Echinicola pacifica]|uniref:SusC/RagA family TonB-linked outer membrane protein n=1 Tax=Echinicola pacifica TaxID=346377 RepID=A0A918PKZ5_9BACT|nr:TonB-dependent receptor [Echinicola pacifica]GGZ13720.1 SusC/RagA family TonB-linked outer membrane protein [Echinicola pacifica]